MHTPLTPLTLGPQPPKPNLQITNLAQRLLIHLPHPGCTVRAECATDFFFGGERLLAAHAGKGFLGEFHEAADGGRGDGDGARVVAGEEGVGFCFAEDGLEDSAERFGELIVEVVFRVNGDVVFEHEDWIFRTLEILGSCGSLDDNVGDTISKTGC